MESRKKQKCSVFVPLQEDTDVSKDRSVQTDCKFLVAHDPIFCSFVNQPNALVAEQSRARANEHLNADETGLSFRQFLVRIYNNGYDDDDYDDDRILTSREVYVFVSEIIADDSL